MSGCEPRTATQIARWDKELERRALRFVRYLDDRVILVTSKRAAHRVMAKVSRYLTVKLKLKVNLAKSRVIRISQLEYLGFRFQGLRIHCTNQVLRDLKHRWRSLPKAYAAIDFAPLGDLDGRTTAAD
jgi:RNA-directed DNA polymerase